MLGLRLALLVSSSSTLASPSDSALSLNFSAPAKISGVGERCASAGGTDGFVAIDRDHVFGPCATDGTLKHTADGGRTWRTMVNKPTPHNLGSQFQWNLIPFTTAAGGKAFHTWGGIDVKSTARTPRSFTGANSTGVFQLDATGSLQLQQDLRRVTIDGLPHDINTSFPTTGMSPGLPCIYGGPIRLEDGTWLATLGIYWAGQPMMPSPDGPVLKMSVIAVASNDSFAWRFVSIVSNATSGASSSVFGPNENDLALLADGKTVVVVLRMDGDGVSSQAILQFLVKCRPSLTDCLC